MGKHLALILSLVAVIVAAAAFVNAERVAEAKIQAREQRLIDAYYPRFREVFRELLEEDPYEGRPQSVEELFRPFFVLVEKLG
jgi:hypothetical protein